MFVAPHSNPPGGLLEGVDLNICRAPSWHLMGLRDANNAFEFDMLQQLLWQAVPFALSAVL
jgi:hypothetical protein